VNRIMKRSVDIIGALVGMTLSCPIIATLGVFIWLESPGNIFFSQERVGRNGRRFNMYKLRSMKLGSDKFDHLSQSTGRADPRVLRVGKFIRRWNLDEVPQFFNVLIGQMSLVGPRPERTFHSEKLSLEIPHYNARLASKPGITGWAQVNGLRGDTDLAERVRYDLYYMENWSLWLDFQIMVQTFFKRDNAY
jgi:exopolysaccharide biosynthesis polyprenyl glycosylphosphotransferase